MRKIGILGGTFDPPHFGHLLMAAEVRSALSLEEVWFMPNNIPPHKVGVPVATNDERVKMLELAIKNYSAFRVETIELLRQGKSFTYDTLCELISLHPGVDFHFIIGADMVEYLPNWYKVDELFDLITFVAVKRPGYTVATEYPVLEVDAPLFDVSSSMLRRRFKNRENTTFLLPGEVEDFIKEKDLYG
ncbi:nicotinate-nucleotide adenylyltransferase [Bacillus sp. HMF5848]|uniref:nicotinate-nucleotide adenylyltransferase n=1 Tax=Bacillus sp. HMF5848 TaxID=2495421 RepID=UPI000F7863DE|nr:nicotinate-nucleotide adenylyltransferase [Bacillus sp. HMF5848]RSK27921.1 nicotinate-nucleotide adenylyltransferase [Bacillus sp. HMF5848]